MASNIRKESVWVVFLFLVSSASATYCTHNSDCHGVAESCCSDSVCRETCYYCSYDFQCGTGECCDSGECKTSCSATAGGYTVGISVSFVFVAIVVSIVACCLYCSCCPYYRYRHPGTEIVTAPANQTFVSTTTATATIQQPPPAGYYLLPQGYNPPPPPAYNPTPAGGYSQPPPYYPPPQAGPGYPPPLQAQGQVPYPPPQAPYPVKQ